MEVKEVGSKGIKCWNVTVKKFSFVLLYYDYY